MEGSWSYKHSAPLEPGRDREGPTNIRLRWSREGVESPTNIRLRWSREGIETVLQTFGSAGAGKGSRGSYKHSAPLEPGGGRESYKHSAPLEPGRGRGLWMLLFDVRVFREAGSSVVPHATRKLVHSAIRH